MKFILKNEWMWMNECVRNSVDYGLQGQSECEEAGDNGTQDEDDDAECGEGEAGELGHSSVQWQR